MRFVLLSVVAYLLVLSCTKPSSFQHNIKSNAKPWTSEPSRQADDKFSFAVISDLNGEERDSIFDVAVAQMNLLKPEFILSIGDLINGGTEDTLQLKKEFDRFDERVAKAGAPFMHVGGNHDLTNVTMRKFWEKRYGARYYHFVYNNVLFLIIDSEDYDEARMQEVYLARKRAIELLDSGKRDEAEKSSYFKMPERATGKMSSDQAAYFEKVLKDNPNVRWTFLFMHKPIWKGEGEGNLSRIESALAGRKYTVMNGHLHNYSYTLKNERDYIMLGTTGGGQNANSKNSFDHIAWITMTNDGPCIANLKLPGILDKTAKIPLNGEKFCFSASECGEQE